MAHYRLLSASLMVVLLLVIMKSDHTEGGSAEKEKFTCKAERESETCVCSCEGKPSSASGSDEVLGTRKLKAKCRCTCEALQETTTPAATTPVPDPLQETTNPATPVQNGWGPWSAWSPCSERCGGGLQTRRRHWYVLGLREQEQEECNTFNCVVQL